jgi:two-component system sensor histidine kinase and response regulator WspE
MAELNHDDMLGLLSIFKQEIETQGKLFEQALLAFSKQPQVRDHLNTAMRAAHSLKGAAQIVGLEKVATWAHKLEDCLVAIDQNQVNWSPRLINSLLRAFDLITHMAPWPLERMMQWPDSQKNLKQVISQELEDFFSHTAVAPVPMKENPLAGHEATLIQLFLGELAEHLAALRTQVTTATTATTGPQQIDADSVHAFHAIKGAAKVIGLLDLAEVSEVFEKLGHLMLSAEVHEPEPSKAVWELYQGYLEALSPLEASSWDQIGLIVIQQRPLLRELKNRCNAYFQKVQTLQEDKKKGWSMGEITQTTITQMPAESIVKVSADNLNRIMALAAELLVHMRQFEGVKKCFLKVKAVEIYVQQVLENTLSLLDETVCEDPLRQTLLEAKDKIQENVRYLREQWDVFDNLMARTTFFSEGLYQGVLVNCMIPFSECIQGFPRLVHDLGYKLDKEIHLEVFGTEVPIDRKITGKLETVLNHIIRNACDHGIESKQERIAQGKEPRGLIRIKAYHNASALVVEISDDGRGLSSERIRQKALELGLLRPEEAASCPKQKLWDFIFMPRFSTASNVSDVSGRGVGLDVVQAFVEQAGGMVRISSQENMGTTFTIHLPILRSVIKTVIVRAPGGLYAFPVQSVYRVLTVESREIRYRKRIAYFEIDQQVVPLVFLGDIFAFSTHMPGTHKLLRIIIMQNEEGYYGLIVDQIIGEANLVVRSLDARLGKVQGLSALALSQEGEPVFIVDIEGVIEAVQKITLQRTPKYHTIGLKKTKAKASKEVLLVDDSPLMREKEAHLLEQLGCRVVLAKDGQEAWKLLKRQSFDLVITDLEMPDMDGFELIQRIRGEPQLTHTPIMVVSSRNSLQDTERIQALKTNKYLDKRNLDASGSHLFLNMVEELVHTGRNTG